MTDRYEAFTKALMKSMVVQTHFEPRTKLVEPSRDEAEAIADAVVEFLTSDEAVTRGIDFLVKHRELIGRDAMRAALLAAVGGSDD